MNNELSRAELIKSILRFKKLEGNKIYLDKSYLEVIKTYSTKELIALNNYYKRLIKS